jgi:cyclophilin family peptidyl-prolyl cis-trans isomerase
MARMMDGNQSKESSGSQFYVCYQDLPDLDAMGATVFGQLINGFEKLKNFQKVSLEEAQAQGSNGVLPPERRTKILRTEVVGASEMIAAIVRGNQLIGALRPRATPPAAPEAATPPGPSAEAATPPLAANEEVVVLTTNLGDVVIELFESDAPKHSENFKKLVREGYYNGLTFHRVIEGFMAQGGDPKGDGTGGPEQTIQAEIKRPHLRGSLAAARKGDFVNPQKASSGSQFYICFEPQPSLDAGGYSVFGQVIQGMDVVDRIPRGSGPNGLVMPVESRAKIIAAKVVPAASVKN